MYSRWLYSNTKGKEDVIAYPADVRAFMLCVVCAKWVIQPRSQGDVVQKKGVSMYMFMSADVNLFKAIQF